MWVAPIVFLSLVAIFGCTSEAATGTANGGPTDASHAGTGGLFGVGGTEAGGPGGTEGLGGSGGIGASVGTGGVLVGAEGASGGTAARLAVGSNGRLYMTQATSIDIYDNVLVAPALAASLPVDPGAPGGPGFDLLLVE